MRFLAYRAASAARVGAIALAGALGSACGPGDVGASCHQASDCRPELVCSGGTCQHAEDVPDVVDATDASDAPDVHVRDVPDAPDVPDVMNTFDVPDAPDGMDVAEAGDAHCPRTILDLNGEGTLTGVLHGCNGIPSTSCQPSASGPEAVYRVHVDGTAPAGFVFDTDAPGTAIDTVLSIRDDVDDPRSERACDDDHGLRTTSLLRVILPPGDHYLIVDQYGVDAYGGPYQLTTRRFAPAPNAQCAAPAPVAPGAPLTAQPVDRGDGPVPACLPLDQGPQLFYSLALDAGLAATITATPSAAGSFRLVLRALADCAATTCVGDPARGAPGAPAVLEVPATSAARTLLFSVGAGDDPLPAGSAVDLSVVTH